MPWSMACIVVGCMLLFLSSSYHHPVLKVIRYIMVDVAVNHVMATSTTPDYSDYFFKDAVRETAAMRNQPS
jgi:hypothetical protein